MTRWHTDKPIRPVASLRGLAPVAPVEMFRAGPATRIAMRIARTFYRERLRQRARQQAANASPSQSREGPDTVE